MDKGSVTQPTEASRDPTFRNYKPENAADYAANRPAYPPKVAEIAMDIHKSTGGFTDMLMDVGCGPATATRQMAPLFKHVLGVDPGQSMIEAASLRPIRTASGEDAKFVVCSAENIASVVPAESVDMILCATSAHWFHMPDFYQSASKVLKPSGSIVLWASGSWFVDPRVTPNAAAMQRMFDELELEILAPFELPGNRLCRQLYEGMDKPWTIDASGKPELEKALNMFDESASVHLKFNEAGSIDPRFPETNGYLRGFKLPFEVVRRMFGTASPVTRWREAHKEQLEKGEIEDAVDTVVRRSREVMAQVPEGAGVDHLEGCVSSTIIVIKKKAEA